MKDFLITIHNGGDEAVAAVQRVSEDWRAQLVHAAAEVESLRLTAEERWAIERAIGSLVGVVDNGPDSTDEDAVAACVMRSLLDRCAIGHQDGTVTKPLPKEKRA